MDRDVMDSAIGWLLDVTIQQNAATLWIKTREGTIIRLIDKFQPTFYILPKNEIAGAELFNILSQQPKITRVDWYSKLTDIFDHDKHGMERLCVYPESTQLFNTDLSNV
jgi:hypothetical protein